MIALAGTRAFVTGGGRVMGRATPLMLDRAGARVVVGYRERKPEPPLQGVSGDLGDARVAQGVIAQVVTTLKGLDILVVNHGVWPPDDVPLAQMTDAQWESTRRANLDAVVYVCGAAIPHLP